MAGDWDDIPKAGINYKTSVNMKMDVRRQKKAVGGYYASVAYMDAQVGKVLDALEESGQADNTIVIFTSDHGYHLGEHDFWAKVSLHEESAMVPLIVNVPGKKPAVCHSFVELLDLYPTLSGLCGLEVPARLQGKDICADLRRPVHARCATRPSASRRRARASCCARTRWAYIQYGEDARKGSSCSTWPTTRSSTPTSPASPSSPPSSGISKPGSPPGSRSADNDLKPN